MHHFNMFLFPSVISKNYSNFLFDSNLLLIGYWHRSQHTYSVKNISWKIYVTFSFSFCVLTGYIFIKFEVAYSTQSTCTRLSPWMEIFWLTFSFLDILTWNKIWIEGYDSIDKYNCINKVREWLYEDKIWHYIRLLAFYQIRNLLEVRSQQYTLWSMKFCYWKPFLVVEWENETQNSLSFFSEVFYYFFNISFVRKGLYIYVYNIYIYNIYTIYT